MQISLWRPPRNRPIPLTCSVMQQMMARFRNFYCLLKSRFGLKRGKRAQCISNKCKDFFERKKYFGVRCTLSLSSRSDVVPPFLCFILCDWWPFNTAHEPYPGWIGSIYEVSRFFVKGGKPDPQSNARANNKLNSHMVPGRARLVGGECSDHYFIPAPQGMGLIRIYSVSLSSESSLMPPVGYHSIAGSAADQRLWVKALARVILLF